MDKMGRTLLTLMLVMVMWSTGVRGRLGRYEVPRVNMIQRRSCYYEPYDKQLTCQCTDKETNTFLKLRLMFFIKEKGQEVGRYMQTFHRQRRTTKLCRSIVVVAAVVGVTFTLAYIFRNCS